MNSIFFDSDEAYDDSDPIEQSQDNVKKQQCLVEENHEKNLSSSGRSYEKNKYIKKLKDIAPILGLEKVPQTNVKSQHSVDKKQRNKFSAKQSRDRKKLYIQIMEEKQQKLQKQLENKKKQLEQTRTYLQKVINQNQTMSSFTTGRHQMIKKLQNLLEEKDKRNIQNDINVILDSLRYRIGATGKQRINTINQYFRQIVNLSLPALHRYMMWSASQSKHMFDNENTQDQWYKDLKNDLNLSEQQKQQIRVNQQRFCQQKKILTQLIQNLRQVKNQIESKSIQLEDMIDSIRQILTPVQCAHFILFIQKNKSRKQLNLCDLGDQGFIRKRIKTQ